MHITNIVTPKITMFKNKSIKYFYIITLITISSHTMTSLISTYGFFYLEKWNLRADAYKSSPLTHDVEAILTSNCPNSKLNKAIISSNTRIKLCFTIGENNSFKSTPFLCVNLLATRRVLNLTSSTPMIPFILLQTNLHSIIF